MELGPLIRLRELQSRIVPGAGRSNDPREAHHGQVQ